ncbi:Restriction endonuclease [Pseudomonas asturiensis]|uniref:Restriction endonuclease n=1 Tax=Pseudomonas asturiensis TaxID=1190415 RepID=A0A1M7PTL4_9PSED|nr:Restriction endonuclease [Pseudomonas asturiensis]
MEPLVLSTYAKGDLFEEQVFQFLSREIGEGRFFCRPEHCRIFRKRRYYSRDREDDIVFDIAIEIFIPGQPKPSMIVLVECKHYTGTVPVGDIEEFGAKIRQVTGLNAKGIFVSASAFQSGTINIARNQGFGVIRYFPDEGFQWELARALLTGVRNASSRKRAEIEYALTHPGFRPTLTGAYAVTPGGYTNAWEGVWTGLDLASSFDPAILEIIRPPHLPVLRVGYISKRSIENLSDQVLRSTGYTRGVVDLEAVVTSATTSSALTVSYVDEPDGALGRITFAPLDIKINSRDNTAPMTRFTLAHELGHYYLDHGRYIARESLRSGDIDQLERIAVPKSELERLEWQANTFASYLLMPERHFLEAFSLLVEHHDIRNRGHGALFLDDQRDNIRNYHLVLDALSRYFAVSKSAAAIRLRGLGVLVEA